MISMVDPVVPVVLLSFVRVKKLSLILFLQIGAAE